MLCIAHDQLGLRLCSCPVHALKWQLLNQEFGVGGDGGTSCSNGQRRYTHRLLLTWCPGAALPAHACIHDTVPTVLQQLLGARERSPCSSRPSCMRLRGGLLLLLLPAAHLASALLFVAVAIATAAALAAEVAPFRIPLPGLQQMNEHDEHGLRNVCSQDRVQKKTR